MSKKLLLSVFVAGVATVFVSSALAQQFGGLLFPDVVSSDYFYDAVNRFAQKGIINGYNTGRFGPYDYVTRGQAAVILDRYDQNVIQQLRKQVEQLRAELGLGRCGDGQVQVGEQCDDGNGASADGCNAECLYEVHCAGGYRIGDRYPAPDGCNICTCTQTGASCTERACTQKKCFSTVECLQGESCSVDEGDCRFPCPKGAVCIQACAGVCIPKLQTAACGNGTCEQGESVSCPQDCRVTGSICGDLLCAPGEADEYTLGENGPALLRRGTCPADCEGGIDSCQQKKNALDAKFEKNLKCAKDDDCTVFVRGCSPYLSCGKALRKDQLLPVTAAVMEYADACGKNEPALCAKCMQSTVICENGMCVLQDGGL